jgi:hypothetical protein
MRRILAGNKAFTFVEMMVSSTVLVMISAALAMGIYTIQRTSTGVQNFADQHADEMRISDYLARDLRSALSVSCTGQNLATVITLNLPNYNGGVIIATGGNYGAKSTVPVINSDGTVSYQNSAGPAVKTSTVQYYFTTQDHKKYQMIRSQDGVAATIADNVQDFQFIALDSTTDPNASTDFNITGITSNVAEVEIKIAFTSDFTAKGTSAATWFYDTTLMRNARTDTKTFLY